MKYDYSVFTVQNKDSLESILELSLDGIEICENALKVNPSIKIYQNNN